MLKAFLILAISQHFVHNTTEWMLCLPNRREISSILQHISECLELYIATTYLSYHLPTGYVKPYLVLFSI